MIELWNKGEKVRRQAGACIPAMAAAKETYVLFGAGQRLRKSASKIGVESVSLKYGTGERYKVRSWCQG